MVHLVQYLQKIFREPTIEGIEDNPTSKERIDASREWAAICKNNDEDSDRLSNVADPGNLRKKKEWI